MKKASSPAHGAFARGSPVNPKQTAALIQRLCPVPPRLALVLGSGFRALLDVVGDAVELPYDGLPGFIRPNVPGHVGKLVIGRLERVPVLLLAGRAHFYEGHDLATVTFPIRVLAALGLKTVLLTSAAGGISPRLQPGDFLVLSDHLNLMGVNPLRDGTASGAEGFIDLSQLYDPGLRRLLVRAARAARVRVRQGVYAAVSGPSYETPAEVRALARLGADGVGMSTVPEAIVAHQCGLQVAGLACITNLAAGRGGESISHDEVLATGHRIRLPIARLLGTFVRFWARENPP